MLERSRGLEEDVAGDATTAQPSMDRHVYLTGRPPLKQFLEFVTERAGGRAANLRALTDEWRAARAYLRELEEREAGWADNATMDPLPAHLEPLRDRLLEDPLFDRAVRITPADVAMVELDRLVVYQKHINLHSVQLLKRALGPSPSSEDVFRLCLPLDDRQPVTRRMRTKDNTFVFTSPSHDLRYLGATLLDPGRATGDPPRGSIAGVVGIIVGFSANFLQALHCEDRLVLKNGNHRAFALRDMGITHAPCIVQHVSGREELQVVGPEDVRSDPDLYLKHPRPSVLKDYFEPRLRKAIDVTRKVYQVRVKFEVEEADVPAL